MDEYQCSECGNTKLFYQEVSYMAKRVFNQSSGKEYIRDRSDVDDNIFDPVYCYKCGHCVTGDCL